MDKTLIEDLKAKNQGMDLHRLVCAGLEIVVKVPGEVEWRKFQVASRDERRRLEAPTKLVYDCLVFPDAQALSAAVAKRPGLITSFAGKLVDLAGVAECESDPL